ncbi:histidine phosphatase family protein [Paenibacillus paridis]|uniref:histidine phosphatase family protein n=1 Tax=Paenibacillus paridis TaxID=2583376 RepID=UPI0011203994|nr:histidine phosphatase family protein [Paenibacillus paridis]
MTNLYFVRHAHSVYTPDEVNRPLSEHGCNDAKRVTDLLKEHHIDLVLSSSFKRAMQTVEGAANFIDEAVLLVDGFKERTECQQHNKMSC